MIQHPYAWAARLAAGESLTEAEAADLAGTTDILTLGMMADEARRRRHGAETTFVRVHDVTLPLGGSPLQVPAAAREIRIRGAVEPVDVALAQVRLVVASAGGVPVSAFSLADLQAAAENSEWTLDELLQALRRAGVAAVAEAPLDRLVRPEAACDAVRTAGLELARVTVHRCGDAVARLALIRQAADLQHALGWIRSFAPLPQVWDPECPSTGYDDVRAVALARLLADNIPSIQVDWATYGPKLAQVALTVGADDIDGVPAHDDAPDGRRRAPLEEVRRNVEAAALAPVERDGAYRRIGQ
jgi:aminodeoxyfutalosine synthase